MFSNVVTFRKEDATLELPTYPGTHSGDIRFQMKTTATDGIIFQNTGPYSFLEVRIVCELSLVKNGWGKDGFIQIGWMDGWINGQWLDRWINGWMNEYQVDYFYSSLQSETSFSSDLMLETEFRHLNCKRRIRSTMTTGTLFR